MLKKMMMIALISCAVFAVTFNADAACRKVHKIEDSEQDKPSSFRRISLYILLYIPNRIVDFTDMYSFNMNFGDTFAMEMQATRFAQLGGCTGTNYFITKGYSRQIGTGHKKNRRFGFVYGENDETVVDETTGSVKEYMIYAPNFLTANYRLEAFQDDDVDFWKIGGSLGWFIGGGFGIHPVEVADFFTGIFGIDISEDDF